MIVAQWFDKPMRIAQTVWRGLQYSLLSDDNKQCHPFVYCKEFILDVIWSTLNKRSIELYGFHYNPERGWKWSDPPASLNPVRMLLRNKDDADFPEHVPKCLKFLNKLEDEFGFPHSEIEICENATAIAGVESSFVYLLSSPDNWLHAPPLLSLLTLMVRIGMIYDGRKNIWKHAEDVAQGRIKPYQYRDNDHLHRAYKCIQNLIETKCERFPPDRKDNWPVLRGRMCHMEIHENGGIVSLASGAGRWVCPGWYPKLDEAMS